MRFNLTQLFSAFCIGILIGAAFILLLPKAAPLFPPLPDSAPAVPLIMPIFSPEDGPEILSAISSAQTSFDVEMYLFSYKTLAAALVAAKERGVRVRVLLEPTLENNPNLEMAQYLRDHGIEVRWALPSRTNHAKFAIIDGKRVLVGSHNWSYSAMNRNREASVLIEDSATASDFQSIFNEDWNAAYT